MASLSKEVLKENEFKVRDLKEADFGRLEIELAECEMPGLMACREKYGNSKPLSGARIGGCLHMTIQTAVLIETLVELGADVRWCSSNIYSTQDHAAAAVARDTCSVFAWKGESVEEYWWCMERMLTWPDGTGPDLMVDDGSDATSLVHEGVKAEKEFEKTGKLPDPELTSDVDYAIIFSVLRKSLQKSSKKWHKISEKCIGVSEQTTTGVNRLYKMEEVKMLLFPAIGVNDSVTKSKFDNIYGCRHSLTDGIMRATDVMIAGKTAVVAGYGDVGKGSASAMKGAGARVFVSEIDPICALQACMEGYTVVRMEEVLDMADIFITTTGNKDVITAEHMKRMKNNAIVGNIGNFHSEIDMAGLLAVPGIKRQNIKPQCDRFIFEDGKGIIMLSEGHLLNLGCATGHPSFVMSCSFTNQVIAQLELWNEKTTGRYENKVYVLPKHLDEKVALLHLPKLGARMTKLTKEQSDYVNIPVEGPYKPPHYRY